MEHTEIVLDLPQARRVHLAAQGLLQAPRGRTSPQRLLETMQRMRVLQIDTIHVVARSPYLTLFSRLGAYPQEWLDRLLAEGALAECWAHEACFVPAADHGLHRAARPLRAGHWAYRHAQRCYREHREGMRELLEHVRRHGAVRSSDFQRNDGGGGGWWQWKPEKRFLEAWFALGELMVDRRERFQRVYDVSERVQAKLRRHAEAVEPASAEQARSELVLASVQALGVARPRWIGDYFRLGTVGADELDALVEAGALRRVRVRGWDEPALVHPAQWDLVERARSGRLRATHTTLLSPFDPVVWDRTRAQELFDFRYTLECYLPASKRRYGYFVLPVLHRGRLIGRLDAKAHRGEGRFEVRALHLEEGVPADAATVAALALALRRCADWHGTPRVTLSARQPRALLAPLREALRG